MEAAHSASSFILKFSSLVEDRHSMAEVSRNLHIRARWGRTSEIKDISEVFSSLMEDAKDF
jgi:hypothetical protein